MVPPTFMAISRRDRIGSITITCPALASRAAWIAPMPTGPAPCTTTFQPGSICTRSRPAARPVPTVSPSRVNCSAGRSVNTGQQYSSGTTISSLNPPSPACSKICVPSDISASG